MFGLFSVYTPPFLIFAFLIIHLIFPLYFSISLFPSCSFTSPVFLRRLFLLFSITNFILFVSFDVAPSVLFLLFPLFYLSLFFPFFFPFHPWRKASFAGNFAFVLLRVKLLPSFLSKCHFGLVKYEFLFFVFILPLSSSFILTYLITIAYLPTPLSLIFFILSLSSVLINFIASIFFIMVMCF